MSKVLTSRICLTFKIFTAKNTTELVVEIRPEKIFRPVRDLNPWPLQYRCSALPTGLTSHLGAGQYVGSKLTIQVMNNTGVQIYEFHISKIIIQDLLKFKIISFILVILTVLSMRFEVGGYLSKVLLNNNMKSNFALASLLVPFRIKWL